MPRSNFWSLREMTHPGEELVTVQFKRTFLVIKGQAGGQGTQQSWGPPPQSGLFLYGSGETAEAGWGVEPSGGVGTGNHQECSEYQPGADAETCVWGDMLEILKKGFQPCERADLCFLNDIWRTLGFCGDPWVAPEVDGEWKWGRPEPSSQHQLVHCYPGLFCGVVGILCRGLFALKSNVKTVQPNSLLSASFDVWSGNGMGSPADIKMKCLPWASRRVHFDNVEWSLWTCSFHSHCHIPSHTPVLAQPGVIFAAAQKSSGLDCVILSLSRPGPHTGLAWEHAWLIV